MIRREQAQVRSMENTSIVRSGRVYACADGEEMGKILIEVCNAALAGGVGLVLHSFLSRFVGVRQ